MMLKFMKKIILFSWFLLLPTLLLGQDLYSGLKVNTNPSGARVILDGELIINGLSPIGFPGELQGKYKLTIREDGYETYRQSLYLFPYKSTELTFSLVPKTRFKAAWRSMIIPGWGQMYSGRKGKGIFFTVLAAGAAGYYFITDDDFSEKLNDYNQINFRYNSAETEAEKASLYSLLGSAKQKAYDAENKRVIALGGMIGIWGLNLIDALFFFPREKGNVAVNSLTIKPDSDHGGAQIVFSHRF